MKKYKYLLIFALGAFTLSSCFDDEVVSDQFGAGSNLVGFTDDATGMNLTAVADGNEYEFDIKMMTKGARLQDVSNAVTATISIDASSTAIEGTHFRLDSKSIILSPDNNLLGLLPITMITTGINPPLDEDPVVVLNIESVSGDGSVVVNGKQLKAKLLYLCNSDLAGDYALTVDYWRFGALVGTYNFTDTFTKTGDGQYRTNTVGAWFGTSIGGDAGFTFIDVCDQITIPAQNLVNLYSNIVEGVAGKSSVDPLTGDIYMEYTVCATDCREYYANYVKL
ncbi:hypothetical protein MNBD_UNCLBAC01-1184 [hydrothermal vent metagenome]|uniref:DUF1735 domain-containing protein n=1 Tax=hydrothermal vent metagenome TaxID=652676 RepID=A0A3B1D118_9ZZZZ